MTRTTYQLPGVRMSVEAKPERVRSALEWLFQVCPQTAEAPDLHLEAAGVSPEEVITAVPEWMRDALPSVDSPLSASMVPGPDGQTAVIGRFDGLLFCAWTGGESVVHLVCGLRDDRPTRSIIPSVLFPVLRNVFLRRQRLLLHSAAVQCPNGLGLQFVALSCGGKTTTSLSLVRLGARLIADDLVIVSLADGKPVASGLPKPLNLREPTLGCFEELREFAPALNASTGRASIVPQSVYGADCLEASSPIDVLYFLNLTAGRPALSRLDNAEALRRLLHSHAFCTMQTTGSDSVVGLCDLLSRVAFHQLDTGDDPAYLGKWLLENSPQHARRPASGPG